MYRTHVRPVFGDMTLAQVASDRDGVMDLLAVKMKHLSNTPRQQARYVIVATLDEAVKAGKLSRHRLDGIELADHGRYSRKNFVFPAYEQVRVVADGGINPETKRAVGRRGTVRLAHAWLRASHRRGACGVARGFHRGRHRLAGGVAGVEGRQEAGTAQAPQGRRVPRRARAFLAVEMVRDMPDGPLIPGNGRLFQQYGTILFRFTHAAEVAGIPDGFTPHSLRHAFASAMLARGVQITELAHFLGHRDINVTHQVYGHLLPSAAKRAVAALDAEFAEWMVSLALPFMCPRVHVGVGADSRHGVDSGDKEG